MGRCKRGSLVEEKAAVGRGGEGRWLQRHLHLQLLKVAQHALATKVRGGGEGSVQGSSECIMRGCIMK